MIKKIVASSTIRRFIFQNPANYIADNRYSLLTNKISAGFSQPNKYQPKNKQQAWMMQEQKMMKTPIDEEDTTEGKSYDGYNRIGVLGMTAFLSGLGYILYYASSRSDENLDLLEEDISGLQQIKSKQAKFGGDWTLIDTEGRPFSSRDLYGYYYMIYFGYTSCPDICPSTLYYISSIYRIIRNIPEGAYMKLKVVFVSIDPERDSPKVMKDYLSQFGKQIIGVTGSGGDSIQVKECLSKYKIKAQKVYYQEGKKKGQYEIDHTTRVFLIDPQGNFLDFLDPAMSEQQNAKAIVAKIVQNEHFREKAQKKMAGGAAAFNQ